MMTLGPFAVAPDGTLSLRTPGLNPVIRFAWRGRICEALMVEGGLQLRAIAGRIPSTAERGTDRHGTMRAVADLPPDMPEGWRLRLTADHRLALETSSPICATAVAMVSEMVRFALTMDPYLSRLEDLGANALPSA